MILRKVTKYLGDFQRVKYELVDDEGNILKSFDREPCDSQIFLATFKKQGDLYEYLIENNEIDKNEINIEEFHPDDSDFNSGCDGFKEFLKYYFNKICNKRIDEEINIDLEKIVKDYIIYKIKQSL